MTSENRTKWTGKTALICGGSQGLGLELARQLCRERVARLILVARDSEKLQLAVQELKDREAGAGGVELQTFAVDATNSLAMQELSTGLHASPPIDLLIQAVGMSDRGTLQDLEPEHLRRLFEINVISSLHTVRWLSPSMQRPGTIILVGSLASHFAPRYLGGYAIAKHALAGLAQQARLELQPRQIHVMLASPGPIARSDAGKRYQEAAGGVPAEALGPGGGAKVKGLDPQRLAADILRAAERQKRTAIFPRQARLLLVLSAISPWLGDLILRRKTA